MNAKVKNTPVKIPHIPELALDVKAKTPKKLVNIPRINPTIV